MNNSLKRFSYQIDSVMQIFVDFFYPNLKKIYQTNYFIFKEIQKILNLIIVQFKIF
jgi:hypothetical protein